MNQDIKPVIFLAGVVITVIGWFEATKRHAFIDFSGEIIIVAGLGFALPGLIMTVFSFTKLSTVYKWLFFMTVVSIVALITFGLVKNTRQSNREEYCSKYTNNVNGGYNSCVGGFID